MKVSKVYKDKLTGIQKLNYEILLKGFKDYKEAIRLFDTNIDSLNSILAAIRNDNPMLFYIGEIAYEVSACFSIVKPHYLYQKDDAYRLINDMQKIASAIIQASMSKSEWDMALYIHDWFCSQVKYGEVGQESHTIVGALCNKVAVCEGIAKAVKTLCDYAEIECCIISGKCNSPMVEGLLENHAWNKICINNSWYNLDVTFDITINNRGKIRHDYFLLSDRNNSLDHTETFNVGLICNDESLNYYKVTNRIMNTQQMFLDYIKVNLKNGVNETEIKLPSAKNPETVHEKVLMLCEQALSDLRITKTVSLIYNKTQKVFTIIFL